MKIEIDFSKPEELVKQKRELEMALSTIDSALSAIKKNGDQAFPSPPTSPSVVQPVVTKPKIEPLPEPANSLPNEFNMTQALDFGEEAGFIRASVRRQIESLRESGRLILVEAGQGRRPSRFRKA